MGSLVGLGCNLWHFCERNREEGNNVGGFHGVLVDDGRVGRFK